MNKIILITSSIVVVAAIGGGVYALTRPNEAPVTTTASTSTTPEQPSRPIQKEEPGQASQAPTGTTAGSYVDYSDAALAENSKTTQVLFFHAPWCSQCRAIESDIKSQGVPDGFTVLKVDYDSNQELRKKYGVTLQTTFVKVDSQGNELAKYIAYDEPTFDSVKRNIVN